jgi:hypothetical protein
MTTDAFMATSARLLDRRRYELIVGRGGPDGVLAALTPYRNPDHGYGWALEPDLRSRSSQPVSALHAFEVFADIAPATSPQAAELCDWLGSITLPDGGLPFALPIPDPDGSAQFFVDADPSVSSLHMTAMLAAIAHRVGRHDDAVAGHPWLARATEYSLREIIRMGEPGHALELRYALQFLDTVHETRPAAPAQLRRLRAFLPASGVLPVEGGAEGEGMRPLDFSPVPDRPLRQFFADDVIAADLDRLAAERQADGGWIVDWEARSPLAAVEWRGWATVRAITILKQHGRPWAAA